MDNYIKSRKSGKWPNQTVHLCDKRHNALKSKKKSALSKRLLVFLAKINIVRKMSKKNIPMMPNEAIKKWRFFFHEKHWFLAFFCTIFLILEHCVKGYTIEHWKINVFISGNFFWSHVFSNDTFDGKSL